MNDSQLYNDWQIYWRSYLRDNDIICYIFCQILSTVFGIRFMFPKFEVSNNWRNVTHSYAFLNLSRYKSFENYYSNLSNNIKRNEKKASHLNLKFQLLNKNSKNRRLVHHFVQTHTKKNMAAVPSLIIDGFFDYPNSKFFVLENQNREIFALIGATLEENQVWVNWIYSNKEHQKSGVNFQLYLDLIKYCFQNNFELINFGRSLKDSGVEQFKKKFLCDLEGIKCSYIKSFAFKYLPILNLFLGLQWLFRALRLRRLYILVFLILT